MLGRSYVLQLLSSRFLKEDPSRSRKPLRVAAVKKVRFEDEEQHLEHLENLPRQGQMVRMATPGAAPIWAKAIQSLPQQVFKFFLNAAHDTPPHNSNLHHWKKRSTSTCSLCQEPHQSLIHVLNNCKVALDLRRYNDRHDCVLKRIASTIRDHLPPTTHMAVDLDDGEHYMFPTHIAATSQRPHIVWWDDTAKSITLVELTVCFETSYTAASTRKIDRYSDVIGDARRSGYIACLITLEMGSRGLPDMGGFRKLQDSLKLNNKDFHNLLLESA